MQPFSLVCECSLVEQRYRVSCIIDGWKEEGREEEDFKW